MSANEIIISNTDELKNFTGEMIQWFRPWKMKWGLNRCPACPQSRADEPVYQIPKTAIKRYGLTNFRIIVCGKMVCSFQK